MPLELESGRLRIRVTPPDAKIALDDRYVGTGAAEITVPAKHYKLQLDAPDYQPLVTTVDVLPDREVDQPYELHAIPQVGHRQLILYSTIAGGLAGFGGVGVAGNDELTALGAVVGAVGGAAAAYYGTERDVPLGTSSLTITS